MFIQLETERILAAIPQIEVTPATDEVPAIYIDEPGWLPFTIEPKPACNAFQVLTYTRPVANGACTQVWQVVEPDAPQLAKAKATEVLRIDADVDKLYAAVIGNRGPEYADAERDAAAYIAAGYTGTVPPSVQSWATAKDWTPTEAADDIAAAAVQLNTAKQAIRAARLLRKEQVRNAVDSAALAAAVAAWAGFVAAIKAQLGV